MCASAKPGFYKVSPNYQKLNWLLLFAKEFIHFLLKTLAFFIFMTIGVNPSRVTTTVISSRDWVCLLGGLWFLKYWYYINMFIRINDIINDIFTQITLLIRETLSFPPQCWVLWLHYCKPRECHAYFSTHFDPTLVRISFTVAQNSSQLFSLQGMVCRLVPRSFTGRGPYSLWPLVLELPFSNFLCPYSSWTPQKVTVRSNAHLKARLFKLLLSCSRRFWKLKHCFEYPIEHRFL